MFCRTELGFYLRLKSLEILLSGAGNKGTVQQTRGTCFSVCLMYVSELSLDSTTRVIGDTTSLTTKTTPGRPLFLIAGKLVVTGRPQD